VPTLLTDGEGHTHGDVTRESPDDPAESKTLRMRGRSMHGNREIPALFADDDAADRPGAGDEPNVRHVRRWEVGQLRSTNEPVEQGQWTACGDRGGKAAGQGERALGDQAPDTEPIRPVDSSGVGVRQVRAGEPRHLILTAIDPRQEPYAVIPPVRICAGGAG